MILLLDIGNTHTHVGLGTARAVERTGNFPTAQWWSGEMRDSLRAFVGRRAVDGCVMASVVPKATPAARKLVRLLFDRPSVELSAQTVCGIEVDYPRPETIGADRLANAAAARRRFGAPVVVVDFGTAVTFDVVDRRGAYVGGIIAPGLELMTSYLHEKTALLPAIRIRDVKAVIGRNTEQAMLIGAVHGYRGLVRELVRQLKKELGSPRLPVVATGGCAALVARGLPEITAVVPELTLEGLRLSWRPADPITR